MLILPAVLAPIAVVALVRNTAVYESTATVWVSQLSGIETATVNRPTQLEESPAERQVQVLADLFSIAAFREAAAARASMVPASASERERAAAGQSLAASVSAAVVGSNVISISAKDGDPATAQRKLKAVVEEYQARVRAEAAREAEVVLAYYENQVVQAQKDLAGLYTDLQAYTATLPVRSSTVQLPPDAKLQQLQSRVDAQERLLDVLLSARQDAQIRAAAGPGSVDALFTIQDQANLPLDPLGIPATKRFGYPLAGLVFGLFASAGYLFLVYRTDQSIRSAADLEGLDVAVLGSVPELESGALFSRYTPLRWTGLLNRDYARRVAAAISEPESSRRAS